MEEVGRHDVVDQPFLDPGRQVEPQVITLLDVLGHSYAQRQSLASPSFCRLVEQLPGPPGEVGQQVGVLLALAGLEHVAPPHVVVLEAVDVIGVQDLAAEGQHRIADALDGEVVPRSEQCPLGVLLGESLARSTVPVVHADVGDELHAMVMTAVDQYLQAIHARLVHSRRTPGKQLGYLRRGDVTPERGEQAVADRVDFRCRLFIDQFLENPFAELRRRPRDLAVGCGVIVHVQDRGPHCDPVPRVENPLSWVFPARFLARG